MQYKIGDEVVLRPETKPYTFRSDHSDEIKIKELDSYVYEDFIYKVKEICEDGDLLIAHHGYNITHIAPWHIKHAKEDTMFEDFHKEQFRQYSEALAVLEDDMKAELDKLKDIDIVELRLSIFNGDTSRTLEEMKEIEAWLLREME